MEILVNACERAQDLIDSGAPCGEILTYLVNTAEIISAPGSVSSILVLDKEGLLRNGASPSLPQDYLDAIDRLKPSPTVGTCAAAAATGSMVFTPDFLADEKWGELRHLPLALGFVGAWSMPIKSSMGKILGTFGTYYREARHPSRLEIEAIEVLAEKAADALNASTCKEQFTH